MTQFLTRLKKRLHALQGKRASLAACGLGILLTLAFAPFQFLPAILAFTGLLWLVSGASNAKSAYALGWWFGFGHHVTGLYWITIALGGDAGKFLWVIPLALLLLPAYLALFTGFSTWIYHRAHGRAAWQRVVLFGLAWVLAEWLRTVIMGGFPWNLLGYVWTVSGPTLQAASLVGVYGLSLWAVLLGAMFSQPDRRATYSMLALTLVLAGWGYLRVANDWGQTGTTESKPLVRLVQGGIAQEDKWNPDFQIRAFEKHMMLSRTARDDGRRPDYIVWPETSMPFPFTHRSEWLNPLGSLVSPEGALITGVVRTEGEEENWRVWNSVQVVDGNRQMLGVYDKNKLVPFGEFLPLRFIFNWLGLQKVTHGSTDFSSGIGPNYLSLPGKAGLVQPLICYETIFPAYRPKPYADRPDWLLNVTNDAWFGQSSGPFQHFQMARTRAVERGVPLLRAANSGISGGFDAYGRILGKLSLNETGFVDIELPRPTIVPTWYNLYGEWAILLLGCSILLFLRRSHD